MRAAPSTAGAARAAYEADIFYPNAIGKLSFDEAVVARPDAELQKTAYRQGEWNRYTVEASGDHVRLWVNGTLMTDVTHRGGVRSGKIALQLHGPTEVYFRDLRIRTLP